MIMQRPIFARDQLNERTYPFGGAANILASRFGLSQRRSHRFAKRGLRRILLSGLEIRRSSTCPSPYDERSSALCIRRRRSIFGANCSLELSTTLSSFSAAYTCCPPYLPSPRLKHRSPPCELLLWGEQREHCSQLVRRPAGCGRDNRRRKFGAWSYRFLKAGAVALVRLGHVAGFCRFGFEVFGCGVRFFFALDAHRQPSRGIVHTIWCVPWCYDGFVSQNQIVVAK
jgi:hypothetical protein